MKSLSEILADWETHFEWNYVKDHYAPCHILDFGCGYGYSDIWLARNGFAVTGYDPDEARIAVANDLRAGEFQAVQNVLYFHSLPVSIGGYGLIWSSHVFEHIPHANWEQILRLFQKLEVPVLLSVPLGDAYDVPDHIHHWQTAQEFKRDLLNVFYQDWTVWEDPTNRVIKATIGDWYARK
jgi:SAM-dependent methyltransferase